MKNEGIIGHIGFSTHAPLEVIIKAIEAAGYKPGEEVFIALDPASSEMYDKTKMEAEFKEMPKEVIEEAAKIQKEKEEEAAERALKEEAEKVVEKDGAEKQELEVEQAQFPINIAMPSAPVMPLQMQ